ncbi:MAG: fucose isomerase [Clostridia bacterium]|nr:fucose isomerase [Clostridia bacterium]
MLKNIPRVLSPRLLKVLSEMGHGDEIVIADGNFPAESMGKNCVIVRMDGHEACELLKSIIKFFPLYQGACLPVMVMETDDGSLPPIWDEYLKILIDEETERYNSGMERLARNDFYERAKRAYAIIATGERALYANIILKKGVC